MVKRERGLKYDIVKSELEYIFLEFSSWSKYPGRGSMHGQNVNKCVPLL